jgi:hypothetical protein
VPLASLRAADAPPKCPLLLANYYCWYHDVQHPKQPFLHWTYPASTTNADGQMTDEQQREYLKDYEAKLISPAEVTASKRWASNAGYHYLGCAKTFALMGKAFAEAMAGLMGEK